MAVKNDSGKPFRSYFANYNKLMRSHHMVKEAG
jgi:hypothetical protein